MPVNTEVIALQTLTVLNLSEDMNEVSTKEDEIYLLIFLIQSQNDSSTILGEWTFEHTFTQRGEMARIDQSISVSQSPKNSKLIFFLTELDYENSTSNVSEVLKQILMKDPTLNNYDDTSLDKSIKYDDFLGRHVLDLDQLSSKTSTTIKFSGLQMFDRYEYLLRLKF